jgi:tryptophan-rich sensory protein
MLLELIRQSAWSSPASPGGQQAGNARFSDSGWGKQELHQGFSDRVRPCGVQLAPRRAHLARNGWQTTFLRLWHVDCHASGMNPHTDTTPRLGRLPAAACGLTALVWPSLAGIWWGPQHVRSGAWYLRLRKPPFQPPSVAIPLAWGVINSGLAAGAYRMLRQPASTEQGRAVGWWALNVALIGAWSGVFFGRRDLPAATVMAAAMVGTGVAYVAQARKVDTPAAVSGVALVGWLAFATVLTAELWRRNR